MRQHRKALAEHKVAVLVVTFEASPLAQAYARDTDLPWPVVIDSDRALYRGYGMARAPARKIWSPRTLWTYARLLLGGRRLRSSTGDVRQRGGDVVVGPDGRIRYVYVGDTPADRPSAATLLHACTNSPPPHSRGRG